MVARAWAERGHEGGKASRPESRTRLKKVTTAKSGAPTVIAPGIESVSLCLLLNRRTKTMRVIDFRAGPSHAKRLFVLNLAKREGIEKVYTLVERDEVSTWMKLGLAKEASIPGFYKRSDAFLLGTNVAEALDVNFRGPLDVPTEDDDEDVVIDVRPSPAHDRAEKTLVQAKKAAKALADKALPLAKVAQVKAESVQKTLEKTLRSGSALTAFESFGRDVERRHFLVTARNGFELVASTESQSCFANAFLELLTAPTTEHERLATVSALRTICDKLLAEGVVGCSRPPSCSTASAAPACSSGTCSSEERGRTRSCGRESSRTPRSSLGGGAARHQLPKVTPSADGGARGGGRGLRRSRRGSCRSRTQGRSCTTRCRSRGSRRPRPPPRRGG